MSNIYLCYSQKGKAYIKPYDYDNLRRYFELTKGNLPQPDYTLVVVKSLNHTKRVDFQFAYITKYPNGSFELFDDKNNVILHPEYDQNKDYDVFIKVNYSKDEGFIYLPVSEGTTVAYTCGNDIPYAPWEFSFDDYMRCGEYLFAKKTFAYVKKMSGRKTNLTAWGAIKRVIAVNKSKPDDARLVSPCSNRLKAYYPEYNLELIIYASEFEFYELVPNPKCTKTFTEELEVDGKPLYRHVSKGSCFGEDYVDAMDKLGLCYQVDPKWDVSKLNDMNWKVYHSLIPLENFITTNNEWIGLND